MTDNQTQHTPGPWSVDECRSGFAVYAYKSGDAVVRTEDDEGRYGTIANEANARLIAAAPELLEACKAVLEAHPMPHGINERRGVMAVVETAVAKALGND